MEKLNFQKVRIEKGLTCRAVADAANVPLREEYLFELGATVGREVKHKIVHAFSMLTGDIYTLSDFERDWLRERQGTATRTLSCSGGKKDTRVEKTRVQRIKELQGKMVEYIERHPHEAAYRFEVSDSDLDVAYVAAADLCIRVGKAIITTLG